MTLVRDELDVFDTTSFVEFFASVEDEIALMNALRSEATETLAIVRDHTAHR